MFADSRRQRMPAISSAHVAEPTFSALSVETNTQDDERVATSIIKTLFLVFAPPDLPGPLNDWDCLYIVRHLSDKLRQQFFEQDLALKTVTQAAADAGLSSDVIFKYIFDTLSPVYDTRTCKAVLRESLEILKRSTPLSRKMACVAGSVASAAVAVFSHLTRTPDNAELLAAPTEKLKQTQSEIVFGKLTFVERTYFEKTIKLGMFQFLSSKDFVSGTYDKALTGRLFEILEKTSLNITDVVALFGIAHEKVIPERLWLLGYSLKLHLILKDPNKCQMTMMAALFGSPSWQELAENHLKFCKFSIYDTIRLAAIEGRPWLAQTDFQCLQTKSEHETLAQQILKNMSGWDDFVDFTTNAKPGMSLQNWIEPPFNLLAEDFLQNAQFELKKAVLPEFKLRHFLQQERLHFDKYHIDLLMNSLQESSGQLFAGNYGLGARQAVPRAHPKPTKDK